MAKFIEWYSSHNTMVIQGLAVLIALIICVLLFRIFFGAPVVEGAASAHSQLDGLEEKINKILENNAAVQASGGASMVEVENMRSEIYNLRQALKEKESAPVAAAADDTSVSPRDPNAPVDTTFSTLSQEDLKKYQKQIDDLKGRLAEYELIAEDIADLHKLREENQKLKIQLGQSAAEAGSLPEPETEPLVESMAAAEPVLSDEPIVVEEPPMEAASEESETAAAPVEPIVVAPDAVVNDAEKNLLDEFEKNTQKG